MSEVHGMETNRAHDVTEATLQAAGSLCFYPVVEAVGPVERLTLGGMNNGDSDNDDWDTYYRKKPKGMNDFTGLSPL
jgi:hypothetical protein